MKIYQILPQCTDSVNLQLNYYEKNDLFIKTLTELIGKLFTKNVWPIYESHPAQQCSSHPSIYHIFWVPFTSTEYPEKVFFFSLTLHKNRKK